MASQAKTASNVSFRRVLRELTGLEHERGFALPGAFYTDPRWLQVERDELFRSDWFCVGRADEVSRPGDYFCFDQVGEPVLVVHGGDGKIRALANVCRHRGTVVARAAAIARSFSAPTTTGPTTPAGNC